MLSFKVITSAGRAAHYFENTDDYYTKDGPKGQWEGKGSAALGLKGGVDSKQFKKLLEGYLPNGERVRKAAPKKQGNGKESKARLGIDFTFSAPKSVSMAALITGDKQLIRAHDEAVKAAVAMLEGKAVARQKVKGMSFRQHTGNLIVATFRHELSRAKDPQLHTHAVTMNLTQREDGQWVALTNDEMLKSVKTVGAYYRAALAERLTAMGYDIRTTRNGFELAEVSDQAIKLFSKRSKQIEDTLEKFFKTRKTASVALKQHVTMLTRPVKTDTDRAELVKEWTDLLAQANIKLKQPEFADIPMPEPGSNRPGPQPRSDDRAPDPDGRAPDPSKPDQADRHDAGRSGPGATGDAVPQSAEHPGPAPRRGVVFDGRPEGGSLDERAPGPRTGESDDAPLELGRAAPMAGPHLPLTDQEKARKAVDYAIEHLMERQGIFTQGEMLERAYNNALGAFDAIDAEIKNALKDGRLIAELPLYQSAKSFEREQIVKETVFQADKFREDDDDLKKLTRSTWVALTMAKTGKPQLEVEALVDRSILNGRLVQAEERYTTGEMLGAERQILRMEEEGRGKVAPIKLPEEIKAMFEGTTLNAGQQDAAALILSTKDQIVGIQGYAGVGKSHMLSEAVEAIKLEAMKKAQGEGYQVIGLAPYASQNAALAELGMKSQTLASFLMRPADQEQLGQKAIVFLDEASVVPANQMRDLITLIVEKEARLVLIGDRKQTQAVEAGKPFEQLQDNGMSVAHITEILRQQTPELKSAVVSAANGRIAEATRQLESRTVEIDDPDNRHQRIANDYTALPKHEREQTLLVAGTNDARRSINDRVRTGLGLHEGAEVETLNTVDMSRAEKKVASHYSPTQVLIFEGQKPAGLERATPYVVLSIDHKANMLTLRSPIGEIHQVDPAKHRAISVYSQEVVPLVPGDLIRITRNNNNIGLKNGDRLKVAAVDDGKVTLANGIELPRSERLHLQYGYATTVHSAQGLTANRVMIDADTASLTSNRAVFYVAISRPRHFLKIYTDDKSKLGSVMSREPKKYAALELRGADLEKKMLAAALQRQALAKAIKPVEAVVAKKTRQLTKV